MGGPWVPHSAGRSLTEKIDNGQRRRAELGIPSVAYISDLLARMITGGTSHVRSHTDIDPDFGLKGVEAVAEAAEAVADRITVEQVAFAQGGLLTNPGTAELLEAALATGVGVIGGLDPAGVDGDPVRHLDIVFGLAERYGAKVDIHLHDGGTLGAWQFDLIVERTKATGLGGRVTISHAFAIAQVDAERQQQLAERLAEAGVSLVTAAIFNDPVPPITRLLAAGANVAAGNDGIRDLWTPYGDGDMLRRTMHLAYRSGFFRDEDIETALRVATYGGARALGLSEYGLEVGDPADLVVVAAGTPAEAVMSHPPRSLVIKGGRVVARDGRLA
jgi:cytosine deaminase